MTSRAQHPEKLRELQDLWWVEAAKYNVLPLDWRAAEPLERRAAWAGRAWPATRTTLTYYPGRSACRTPRRRACCNKSWTITADIELPDDKAEGMIVTHGGLTGGYGLYLREGKPTFVYNYLDLERYTFAGEGAAAEGQGAARRRFRLRRRRAMGKGGTLTHVGQRQEVAEGSLDKTIPIQFSLGEGLDIGMDVGSPVDFTYKLPFVFTGRSRR